MKNTSSPPWMIGKYFAKEAAAVGMKAQEQGVARIAKSL